MIGSFSLWGNSSLCGCRASCVCWFGSMEEGNRSFSCASSSLEIKINPVSLEEIGSCFLCVPFVGPP